MSSMVVGPGSPTGIHAAHRTLVPDKVEQPLLGGQDLLARARVDLAVELVEEFGRVGHV